jgi:DNA-binding beta-propeller fold protein YncE
VADQGNHRVKVHDLDGTFVRAFGTRGSGDGQLLSPSGVALAGGKLYVADRVNHRISVFT